jgi:hypothetical protein
MANTYDTEAAAPAEQEPDPNDAAEPDEGEPGEGAKVTKDECHYRRGSPIKNCGLCGHYFGNTGPQEHTCEVVEGNEISQFGYCDYYVREENPFGQQLGPREVGIVDDMMQSGPDQSAHAQQSAPTATIGNRTYR